jgi:epoxyqueuosine reductase
MPAITPEHDIVEQACRLGFAAAGFAEAGDAIGSTVFAQWLAQGNAAGMDYLHRHAPLRRHPASICPEVRSIIAVAARYPVNPAPATGGFCMTARCRDYHDVLRDKLCQLAGFLTQNTPVRVTRICVDSAPLPEREWAMRAGLGWQGRQGQLVSPVAGTCTVLGFLLTDLPLSPSRPMANQCGDCLRCIESCPSGAILPQSRIDARRCISYQTIEHRGEIPAERQTAMGQALFGCDVCTTVCPWNQTATAPFMHELAEPAAPMPDADELAAMSPGTFAARFRGTAVKRSGLDRLQRNAAISKRNRSKPFDSELLIFRTEMLR